MIDFSFFSHFFSTSTPFVYSLFQVVQGLISILLQVILLVLAIMTYLAISKSCDDEQVDDNGNRQEERRAKMAGTHVIPDENFDRRASRTGGTGTAVPVPPVKR